MTANDLFKAGKLQEAIDAQIQEVKSNPADHARRLFLFELAAFAGDLDRARRQIEAVDYQEMELAAAVMNYRKLLDSEQARRGLLRDGLKPDFFDDPPDHVRLRLDAVNRLRENHPAEAADLLQQANAACAVHGELNGKKFDALRDCDDLFAGVLEVMAHGKYYWVPLDQVHALSMNPPRFARDLLWFPAKLEMADAAGDVFLPALYPGSHDHADNAIKLGRATDWKTSDNGPTLGVGARVFLVGEEDIGLLEWRQLKMGD